ncbi:prepilin-type N-terminal cleavage/methylation domain-containing protein [Candidatus Parabeggiatoa sp. HSG14]|uniref:type II secretion system protein n=1 Tax=Candidatus Parabeggiatoa sp. HSG14 TaxID=3055593 RepID=UPI0025A77A19|nr:prepilin-type N-terminal cleavage/methylation domain-containing protein [Thiotrichales bacterium HSG14]
MKIQGFTLIELAIVMVIVSLMLGMVLKGQEIITNAKIKNIENSFNNIAKAISIYKERYHVLPGDDNNAGSKFKDSGGNSIKNGGGDGVIDGDFDSLNNSDESRLVWLHLRHAGLVSRTEDMQQQPSNAFNGLIGVSSKSSVNGAKHLQLFVGFTNIPGNVAVVLESRLDDIGASTGRIRSNKENYDGDNGTHSVFHNIYFSL